MSHVQDDSETECAMEQEDGDTRQCGDCPEMDCAARQLGETHDLTFTVKTPLLTCGHCLTKLPCSPAHVSISDAKVRVVEFEPPKGWGYSSAAKKYLCPTCLATVKQLIRSFITPDDPRAARA